MRPAPVVETSEYLEVRALIETGSPLIFVTGKAGTGKSTLVQYLRDAVPGNKVVVAPTGVAALNVGGVTLHSFFHIPRWIQEDRDIREVMDRKIYTQLQLLIIDEISMVRCDVLDSVDKFLRKNRRNPAPFGGVQVVVIGDMFQLPPVVPRQERDILDAKGYASPHFFSALSLRDMSMIPIELSKTYRQSDPVFIDLLNNIRVGLNVEETVAELNRRCHLPGQPFQQDITLTCKNIQADRINISELRRLDAPEFLFEGVVTGTFSAEEDKLPTPMNLKLRVGAHVMFTRNDEARRWVNGTLGTVRELTNERIRVELLGGALHDVPRVVWENFKYVYDEREEKIVAKTTGDYTQYPLMLAWAVTINKSQGKSFDRVMVDLGTGAFATGQVYVALSRCRTIEGLRLARPIRVSDVQCDPVIRRFYELLDANKNLI